ncbi:hypothetical protein NDU88_000350 [Pleurodeles waltl]|uniref:Uncharacterized protein n=1 Tax=Pleurodeles waltl TaxID=8319 RepID=A0AAV7Q5G1_PLEWA|nr:hypothetical protein NDU88_000350 [Pleurodeles waltl]
MRDPNLEESIQIAKRMEHAAVWLQEMDVKSTQAEQGIVAEIKRKEEPRGAVRWNKFDKDDDGVRENKVEKRKTQDWRLVLVSMCTVVDVVHRLRDDVDVVVRLHGISSLLLGVVAWVA